MHDASALLMMPRTQQFTRSMYLPQALWQVVMYQPIPAKFPAGVRPNTGRLPVAESATGRAQPMMRCMPAVCVDIAPAHGRQYGHTSRKASAMVPQLRCIVRAACTWGSVRPCRAEPSRTAALARRAARAAWGLPRRASASSKLNGVSSEAQPAAPHAGDQLRTAEPGQPAVCCRARCS